MSIQDSDRTPHKRLLLQRVRFTSERRQYGDFFAAPSEVAPSPENSRRGRFR